MHSCTPDQRQKLTYCAGTTRLKLGWLALSSDHVTFYDQPCHSWGSKSSIFLFPTYPYPHDIHTLPIIHGGQFYSEFSLQFGTNIFVSPHFLGVLSARLFSTFSNIPTIDLSQYVGFCFEAYIFLLSAHDMGNYYYYYYLSK